MAIVFPDSASITLRLVQGYELSYDQMDSNWTSLKDVDQEVINVIKGAAYVTESNTFTTNQVFASNVGISGSLSGSIARFGGQVFSNYPGVGFVGTASWAMNVVGGGGGGSGSTDVSTYLSSSWTGSKTSQFSGTSSYVKSADSSSKTYIASNGTTNTEYTLVFKNDTGALNDYYQLGADGSNGPYYNPSSNTLTVPIISGSSVKATSFTGSLLGSASYATSASYALTASYAVNGTTTLSVGAFSDTTTQTVLQNTSASLTFNTTDISDGVTLGIAPNNSRIIVSREGTYNLQFSVQIALSTGANGTAYLWLRKNGLDQIYSNTGVYMQNTNDKHVAAWNFVLNLLPGDFLELIMWAQGGNVQALTEVPVPGPGGNGNVGVPSVIATITQIK